VAVRPLVRHACNTLSELSRQYSTGRISGDRWVCEVKDVISSLDASFRVGAGHVASSPAPASPRETDSSEPVAAKLSVRLLHTHGADDYSVKGHTA
jgi:hypothetical protein